MKCFVVSVALGFSLLSACPIDSLTVCKISAEEAKPPIPNIEREWTLKSVAIAEKSQDGSYKQLLKSWEYGGLQGLTLSIVFLKQETYVVRAWKNGEVVESAAQPQNGVWVMVKTSRQQFDEIVDHMKNPTEVVSTPPMGITYRFRGVDDSEIAVTVVMDDHYIPAYGPPITL